MEGSAFSAKGDKMIYELFLALSEAPNYELSEQALNAQFGDKMVSKWKRGKQIICSAKNRNYFTLPKNRLENIFFTLRTAHGNFQYNSLNGMLTGISEVTGEVFSALQQHVDTQLMGKQGLVIRNFHIVERSTNLFQVIYDTLPGFYSDSAKTLSFWHDITEHTIKGAVKMGLFDKARALHEVLKNRVAFPISREVIQEMVQRTVDRWGTSPRAIECVQKIQVSTPKSPLYTTPLIERYHQELRAAGTFNESEFFTTETTTLTSNVKVKNNTQFPQAMDRLIEEGRKAGLQESAIIEKITVVRFKVKPYINAHSVFLGLAFGLVWNDINAAPPSQKFGVAMDHSVSMSTSLIAGVVSLTRALRIGLAMYPATAWSIIVTEVANQAVELLKKDEIQDALAAGTRKMIESYAPKMPKVEEVYAEPTPAPETFQKQTPAPASEKSAKIQWPSTDHLPSVREMIQGSKLSSEDTIAQRMESMRSELNRSFLSDLANTTPLSSQNPTVASAGVFFHGEIFGASIAPLTPSRPDIFSELRQSAIPSVSGTTLARACPTLSSLHRVGTQFQNPIGSAVRTAMPIATAFNQMRTSASMAAARVDRLFNP